MLFTRKKEKEIGTPNLKLILQKEEQEAKRFLGKNKYVVYNYELTMIFLSSRMVDRRMALTLISSSHYCLRSSSLQTFNRPRIEYEAA